MTSGQPLKIVQRHMAHPVCRDLRHSTKVCTKGFFMFDSKKSREIVVGLEFEIDFGPISQAWAAW